MPTCQHSHEIAWSRERNVANICSSADVFPLLYTKPGKLFFRTFV